MCLPKQKCIPRAGNLREESPENRHQYTANAYRRKMAKVLGRKQTNRMKQRTINKTID